jgi:lipid-A-disaccharide synthase
MTLVDGRSRRVIAAADCVLTASGTATLECLLLKRPMAVAYRVDPITYRLVKGLNLIKVPHVAMANLLAGRELAPEFLQERCRAELIGPALLAYLDDGKRVGEIQAEYLRIHRALRRNAAREAASAILGLVGRA